MLLLIAAGVLGSRRRCLRLSVRCIGTGGAVDRFARMPIFYLHLCNGHGFVEDEQGHELADLAAARKSAIASLRDVTAGEMQRGELNLGSFIEIEDEDHKLLERVEFSEAVSVRDTRGSRPDT